MPETGTHGSARSPRRDQGLCAARWAFRADESGSRIGGVGFSRAAVETRPLWNSALRAGAYAERQRAGARTRGQNIPYHHPQGIPPAPSQVIEVSRVGCGKRSAVQTLCAWPLLRTVAVRLVASWRRWNQWSDFRLLSASFALPIFRSRVTRPRMSVLALRTALLLLCRMEFLLTP